MDTRASTRTRLSVLPVFIALVLNLLLPIAPTASSLLAANDGIDDYAQCQIGDGAGLDCASPPEVPASWTNGILNDTHNDYAEDEVVPQRLQMTFEPNTSHYVTIRYMTRKDSSGQRHAYDYLATWNYTYVNANRCQDLPSGVDCVGGTADTYPIPSDPNSVSPGGPQPTSAHELPQADRQFVMYGGDITSTSAITHAVDPNEAGSDYGIITVYFTVGASGEMQLLWGGHLASGFGPRGWGENLGAAAISGGPYHMIVDAVDGESIGQRDNQIMSNAIAPLLPTLSITKTPDGANVNAGEYASFTITVTNNGPGVATNVDIDDDLPEGPSGTNTGLAWEEFPDKGECTIVSNNLHCDVASLAVDASFSVTVRALTDSGDCGTINNSAFADADNNPQVNDTGYLTVLCPSIRIEKTPDENAGNPGANDIQVGSAATFTITVYNDGGGTASGVNVFDDLPGSGWTVDAANTTLTGCAVTDPTTGDHADKGEILTCGPDSIAGSSSKKVTVSKTTATADCGEINNTASVTTTNDGSDSDAGNIDVLCPLIRIEKEPDEGDAGSTVNAGGTATFSMTVYNDGNGTASGVTLFDDLPGTGWSVDAANTTLAGCAVTDPTVGEHADKGEILTCGPDTINAQSSKKVTVTNPISVGECDDLPNSATAASTNDGSDTDGGLIAITCPEIRVEKTPDEATDASANDVNVGENATFTITVYNEGDGLAEGVNLFDDLPGTGWIVDSANTTLTGCAVSDPGSGEHADKGEILTCGPDTIAAEASKKVTVTKVTSYPTDCGSIDNTAAATSTNAGSDTDPGNIDVLCPDLDIDKTTSTPTINAGETASYQITVTNDGEGDAVGVDISDTLPSGLTWSDDSASCSITSNVLTCSDLTIPAGEDFTVTVTGTTDSGECPSILNRATFTSDNAGSGASAAEGQGTLITVNCPDLEVEKEQVDANGEPTDDPVSAGETAYFAIHVTNHGPGTAFDVDVLDFAPDGTVWTVVDDGGFTCPATIDDAGDSCTAAEFAPGTTTIILSFATDLEDCGQLENNVSVSATNEPAAWVGEDNEAQATITVECPRLNVAKEAVADPVDAGETASFTIVVWNTGPGTAFDVTLTDDLPGDLAWTENSSACSITAGVLSCDFGDLGVVSQQASTARVTVSALTDRSDCGVLDNTAIADSNPGEPVPSSDSITVKCPVVSIQKDNNQPNPVLPGTNVTFTLKVTVTDGPADNVVVVDTLPAGYDAPTNISNDGEYTSATRTITWNLGTVGNGNPAVTLTYQAAVSSGVAHGTQLLNVAVVTSSNSQCPSATGLAPECDDDSIVTVRVPTLVIDKVANAEAITISGPNTALVATPSVVTWTLTYTLTNGPVTNAVITDPVPVGFTFLDASNGGTFANGVITWNLGTLTASGSVSFRTTVDPTTISRIAPTVNTATIDSNETPPDQGQDSVTVSVVPPPLAGNPTPKPSLPNTAAGIGMDGQPVTVPVELLVAFFLGSLGVLTLANVRTRSRRR